jgi:hypothetical protein
VSMGWVPIQYKQLQLKDQKYKEGNLNQDKKWQKRRPTAKPPAKKRKTVEEDNKIFPMRMRRNSMKILWMTLKMISFQHQYQYQGIAEVLRGLHIL